VTTKTPEDPAQSEPTDRELTPDAGFEPDPNLDESDDDFARDIEIDFAKVRRWTAKTDVFARPIWLVPICSNDHWTLIVVCNASEAFSALEETNGESEETNTESKMAHVLYFDSLGT
jgi:hypothetical protein